MWGSPGVAGRHSMARHGGWSMPHAAAGGGGGVKARRGSSVDMLCSWRDVRGCCLATVFGDWDEPCAAFSCASPYPAVLPPCPAMPSFPSPGDNTKVSQSVIGRNCRIGRNADVFGSYVMDGATVQVGGGGKQAQERAGVGDQDTGAWRGGGEAGKVATTTTTTQGGQGQGALRKCEPTVRGGPQGSGV